ncbi:uncharacterized protein LOC110842101 [Folsomia candida]|uniref:Uncharacterized protein n=1 Tax=Folsomia candida TaxID=158441 RepID=A0A226F5N9_FOLCA|nr:uncharacterized protein LOC110842101 [Folsomia candida]OXA65109.1 hypothetical protein Fcan01_03380 [Folsomia candida]
MNFRCIFTALFLVASSTLVRQTNADECKDFLKTMLMDQMKHVVPCITGLGLSKPHEKKEKVFCIMKCVLQKAQMLGADGNVDFDLVNKLLDGIPASLKDKANNIFSECGHLAADLDPNQPNCDSYAPLLTCVTDIGAKMC